MVTAARGKDVRIVGGEDLAAQLYDTRVLDEIVLTIAPVILTRGAPVSTRRIATPPLQVLGVRAERPAPTRVEPPPSHAARVAQIRCAVYSVTRRIGSPSGMCLMLMELMQ